MTSRKAFASAWGLSLASCFLAMPAGADQRAGLGCRPAPDCTCLGPGYPLESRREGEEGSVRLRILVSPEGKAKDILVERSSGYRRLDEAAVEWARWACMRPAVRKGVPIEAWTTIEPNWTLREPAGAAEKAGLRCRSAPDCSCLGPDYPLESRRQGEQGSVRLKVLVSPEGKPRDIVVERSSGYGRLDEAAVDSAKRACM